MELVVLQPSFLYAYLCVQNTTVLWFLRILSLDRFVIANRIRDNLLRLRLLTTWLRL